MIQHTFQKVFEEESRKTDISSLQDIEFNSQYTPDDTTRGELPLSELEYGSYVAPVISDAEARRIKGKSPVTDAELRETHAFKDVDPETLL